MAVETFKPYISSKTKVPEFTFRAVMLGIFLGIIFGVGNTYLGLKVGTTVSASIPAAVLSMAILRVYRHQFCEHKFALNVFFLEEGLVSFASSTRAA